MNKNIAILCIFAISLLIIASYMNSINFWNAVIGIVAGILAALATVWSIIKFYLDKRIDDAAFKQHSSDMEKQNEEFRHSVSANFMTFSAKLDDINKKLDAQGKSIAKLEGKIEEISKK